MSPSPPNSLAGLSKIPTGSATPVFGHALASLLAEAQQLLPEVVQYERDQELSWTDISQLLAIHAGDVAIAMVFGTSTLECGVSRARSCSPRRVARATPHSIMRRAPSPRAAPGLAEPGRGGGGGGQVMRRPQLSRLRSRASPR
jgi:hypothetical protein